VASTVNRIYQGDCLDRLARIAAGSIDLVFADPPFNIGYTYDVYRDRKKSDEYLDWSRRWIAAVYRVVKPDGTFWLAIGDEYAAELKLIAQNDAGFTCRSWVIWYYTFGVNCKRKFSRSHAHLFHFVKDRDCFTFNDFAIRVPSARQLVYADRRANPKGRLPDDTWILRPQDLLEGFAPDHDTWYFPRVAGTFKERAGFHGCQMPEQLLGRIIRCSSNGPDDLASPHDAPAANEQPVDGDRLARRAAATADDQTAPRQPDVVLDPFAGSGTTLAVAKKLRRRYIGIELSADYVANIRARLKRIKPGDPLDGTDQPLASAPSTRAGRALESAASKPPDLPAAEPPPAGQPDDQAVLFPINTDVRKTTG